MAENSLAPGFARLSYSTSFTGVAPRRHTATLPVRFTATEPIVGEEPTLETRGGGTILAGTFATDFLTQYGKLFGTGAEFQNMEFWHKPTPEADPVFIYMAAVVVQPTVTGTNVPYSQATMTFRTTAGGIFRLTAMEGKTPYTNRDLAPYATGTPARDVHNYIVGASSPIIGRDNSYPVASIAYTGKANDHLRKKYLLDA